MQMSVAQPGPDGIVQGVPAQGTPMPPPGIMAPPTSQTMTDVLEEYIPLQEMTIDATNQIEAFCLCIHLPCLGWTTKRLTLEDQEAVLTTKNLCCKTTKRMVRRGARTAGPRARRPARGAMESDPVRDAPLPTSERQPYAQLGNVMMVEQCCGCVAVGSELAKVDQENGGGGISPGCGCDQEACRMIENELQQRKLLRGNVAQVNKLEHLGNKIGEVAYGVDALLDKYKIPYEQEESINSGLQNFYGTKTFDNLACCIESCCCVTHQVVLDKEEAVHYYSDCCTSVVTKREYAHLGYVGREKNCLCCRTVGSEIGHFTPGCGCNRSLVNEVVEELQARKIARGNVGQIREQERLLHKLRRINSKMEALEVNMGVAYPPDVQTMERIFAGAATGVPAVPPRAKGALDGKEQTVGVKTFETTNSCENCLTCCCLETKIELLEDEYHEHEKDCCDDSIMKVPYAQMGSVDYDKCCCCYSVNGMSPGCFCNGARVEEIAGELQERKVKRGNILQLQQLEAFQTTAQELDLRSHLVLDKHSVVYPPTDPAVISQVYGTPVYRILGQPFGLMHPEASRTFEAKDYGDVTNFWECCCCFLCCLGKVKKSLEMSEEEVHVVQEGTCYRSTVRRPYPQLGDVEVSNCMCCVMVDDVGSPGCGCNHDLVGRIASDLQERKVLRGNIAQLKTSENIMKEILKINAKLRYLHYKLR